MKICYVAVDVGIPYARGASVHVYQASRFLAKAGHEIHVVCRRYSKHQQEHEEINGFHVHRIYRGILGPVPFSSYTGIRRSFSRAGVLRTLGRVAYRLYLRSVYLLFATLFAVDIIDSYRLEIVLERETSMGVGALASMITKRPLVLEINSPEFSASFVRHAKRIVAYPKVKEKLLEMGVSRDKILDLFAAVDMELFKPNPRLRVHMRRKLGLEKKPVVGYVGIFAAWHGIETLLEASKIVLESMPDTIFLMVGPYGQDAFEKAVELSTIDSFRFVGPVGHELVSGYINVSDVMVAPFNPSKSNLTKDAGFAFMPFKLLEYMSCGKPVVSTNVGGIPEFIEEGLTGILVEPGDESDLARAILKLLKEPELAKGMGQRARKYLSGRYSWKNYTDLIEKAIEEP